MEHKTYENVVPTPAKAKQTVKSWNECVDASSMSIGTLESCQDANPNAREKKIAAKNDTSAGPFQSMSFPTNAANGYWIAIPLGAFSSTITLVYMKIAHARIIEESWG
jgi:hypothetical protein